MTRDELIAKMGRSEYYPTYEEFSECKTRHEKMKLRILREKEFELDALEVLRISEHPKAEYLFKLAWDYGHSGGFEEVFRYMEDFALLLS